MPEVRGGHAERGSEQLTALRLEEPMIAGYRGAAAVRTRLIELAEAAREELMFVRALPFDRPEAATLAPWLYRRLTKRGIAVRGICQPPVEPGAPASVMASWLLDAGAQVRTLPVVPLLVTLVDDDVAVIHSGHLGGRTDGLELRGREAVRTIRTLCEELWAAATPFAAEPASDGELAQQEQDLLVLLASGHTDEAAARRLGTSLRTVRRMMADVMTRLGARSRFQAGAQAVRRGWL